MSLAGADRKTGRSRGFAFVEFNTEAEAARALQLNGEWLLGQAVGVQPAMEPSAGEPTTRPSSRMRKFDPTAMLQLTALTCASQLVTVRHLLFC